MVARAGVEVYGGHVLRAALAAHSAATAECRRAIRATRRASDEQITAERLHLRRNDQRAFLADEAERRLKRLRPRELEVMVLLAGGLQTNEVARVLFISELTVRTHVKGALRRCRAHSRGEVFRLLELVPVSDAVRLASRRVEPFLDQWWARAPLGNPSAQASEPDVKLSSTPSPGA